MMKLETHKEIIMGLEKYGFRLSSVVHSMRQIEGADYGNWGVCTREGGVYFGQEDARDKNLLVPLLEIVEVAEEIFPDYGYSELVVIFRFNNDSQIEWIVGRKP